MDKLQLLSEDIKEMKRDIKILLSFRSKVIGFIVAASSFTSLFATWLFGRK